MSERLVVRDHGRGHGSPFEPQEAQVIDDKTVRALFAFAAGVADAKVAVADGIGVGSVEHQPDKLIWMLRRVGARGIDQPVLAQVGIALALELRVEDDVPAIQDEDGPFGYD